MKILYILHSSQNNGSEKAVFNIISYLMNYNIEVVVVLPEKGKLISQLNALGVKTYILPIQMNIYPKTKTFRDFILYFFRIFRMLFYSIVSYFKLKKFVKQEKPDIIHTNVGVVHTGHSIGKKCKIPHVWHIREFQKLHFGWRAFPSNKSFKKKLFHPNNYLTTITNSIYDYYSMEKANKAKVIYDGVLCDEKPEIKADKQKYILFVGRLEEAKGIEELIQAFVAIMSAFPEYELWIAGSGLNSYKNYLQSKINANDLSKIRFLGFRTDVAALMSEATALVVPSRFEGFGFITTEAMYNGCLVIGKNTAGTKEQFDNGLQLTNEEIGIRYTTQGELVSAMQQVVEQGIETYLPMIYRAQKTVMELYTIKQSAEQMYHIYNDILSNKNNEMYE